MGELEVNKYQQMAKNFTKEQWEIVLNEATPEILSKEIEKRMLKTKYYENKGRELFGV